MTLKHNILAGLAALMLAGPAASDDFERAAIVMPGSISDNGWNQAGFEGLTQAGEALGFETTFSESVHQPEQIEVLPDYSPRR